MGRKAIPDAKIKPGAIVFLTRQGVEAYEVIRIDGDLKILIRRSDRDHTQHTPARET